MSSKKPTKGRPKLKVSDVRSIRIVVKTNKSEQRLIAKNAKTAGYPVATYLRMLATGEI